MKNTGLFVLLMLVLPLFLSAQTITSISVKEKTGSSQTQVPVTFALPFANGAVPFGTTLSARLLDNTVIPLQVIKKATHSNGSLRHAIFSLKVPSLSANEKKTVQIITGGSAPSGSDVTIADVLTTTFDATVTITPSGGSAFSVSARDLLQNSQPVAWLTGPIASEWIVKKTDAHTFLAVYFHIRAYAGCQTIRVNAIVENCWTFKAGWRDQTYNVTVASGGSTFYSRTNMTHYHHSRWNQVLDWGTNAKAVVSFNTGYLIQTYAVPSYDTTVVPTPTLINSYKTAYTPLGVSIITPYMPNTGGRPDIGPFPGWSAAYLLTMDDTLWNTVSTVGRSAGSFSNHYRDELTENPLSLADYPDFFVHGNYPAGTDPNTLPAPGGAANSPYTADEAHEPMMAYLPYLLSGDYFYLEELEFWVLANSIGTLYHGREKGWLHWGQLRGAAWCMRELGQLAYILPDNHPQKAHYNMQVNANLDNFENREANNPLGIANCSYGPEDGLYAPWQHDMFTWSMGYLAYMGAWPKAKTQFEFLSKFCINRMMAADFCWTSAIAYWPRISTNTTYAGLYTTMGQYAAGNNYNVSNCPAVSQTCTYWGSCYPQGYGGLFRMAMAMVSKTSLPDAQTAWGRVLTITGSITDMAYASDGAETAIVPPPGNVPTVSISEYPASAYDGTLAELVCFPNPFNPLVTIRLNGLVDDRAAQVVVYDLAGHRVADLSKDVSQGKVEWNASDKASGVYVVKAVIGNRTMTGKIMLLK